ncbi:DUF4350 domain-containing protein [Aureisphaera galaxeae]|uniref:DUF4350 domain-containing protein n=1 Tax=Aureisphaera galaxeae TaxID=1538023 RepID=UPI00235091D2|nr:DUF4350 domain-containing protein [Aureisphaera galaxeae]MDC8003531.1 DUF4350 domain-containing protein [Aureisphaera galaxeae]
MKKTYIIIGIIVALIVVLASRMDIGLTRTVDWEESFDERSNKPYGVRVFYRELDRLFEGNKIRTIYHQPSSYFYANSEDGYGDHVAKGTYMIIGNSMYLSFESVDELLTFASEGNTLFISDYYLPGNLADTLGLDVDYAINEKDSISKLSFENRSLQSSNTIIDKNEGDFFFAEIDSTSHTVLGYTDNKKKRINFIKAPFDEGNIFIHLQPKIFTNYNLLKEDRFTYSEGVLSYLPDEDIYFDSFIKYETPYGGEVEQDSELSWFLEQRAFRWAWYFALLLALLFVIFNAKRRQRIVEVVKPLQNTTVSFVKTISNLYFETKDHENLILKKMAYFLERIRTEYNLDTEVLDEEFMEKLSLKSGVKKEKVSQVIKYISWLQTKRQFFESNLITLNKYIEDFYSR